MIESTLKILNRVCARMLNLVFPEFCLGCGMPGRAVCEKCLKNKISYLYEFRCLNCKKPLDSWYTLCGCGGDESMVGIGSCATYKGLLRQIIHSIKYNYRYSLVASLQDICIPRLRELGHPQIDLVTSVPPDPKRLKQRGFDYVELLARPIAEYLGVPYSPLLQKQTSRRAQVGRSKVDRIRNVSGVYVIKELRPNLSPHGSILLIDDVFTTGSTLKECAKQLKSAGWQRVYGFTAAREL